MAATPNAFLAGYCPRCGDDLDGIDATAPGQHEAQPCECTLNGGLQA